CCDALRQTGEVDMIHLTFRPSGARAFFGMPLLETQNLTISVDALSDKLLEELKERLFETSDTGESVRMMEEYLIRRLTVSKAYNFDRMDAVIRAIDAGVSDISHLADISCLGYRQFWRIFSEYVGMNPKDFIRIVRFHRTLHTKRIHPEMSLARLAVECGSYDQSHLTREFKCFSGFTPSEYFSICDPYSDYFG
ncbi:MAG: helix-turn-helix domain-containing protein, partial [Rikenellaceae bacterium]|nr:helix-turn-helix domain-containing protein [Rikenellaceae bacterium]